MKTTIAAVALFATLSCALPQASASTGNAYDEGEKVACSKYLEDNDIENGFNTGSKARCKENYAVCLEKVSPGKPREQYTQEEIKQCSDDYLPLINRLDDSEQASPTCGAQDNHFKDVLQKCWVRFQSIHKEGLDTLGKDKASEQMRLCFRQFPSPTKQSKNPACQAKNQDRLGPHFKTCWTVLERKHQNKLSALSKEKASEDLQLCLNHLEKKKA